MHRELLQYSRRISIFVAFLWHLKTAGSDSNNICSDGDRSKAAEIRTSIHVRRKPTYFFFISQQEFLPQLKQPWGSKRRHFYSTLFHEDFLKRNYKMEIIAVKIRLKKISIDKIFVFHMLEKRDNNLFSNWSCLRNTTNQKEDKTNKMIFARSAATIQNCGNQPGFIKYKERCLTEISNRGFSCCFFFFSDSFFFFVDWSELWVGF